MKVESRTCEEASVGGYATTMRSGPRRSGTGGSAAELATGVREEGVGMRQDDRGAQAATRSHGERARRRTAERSMPARYTLTMTYAKTTLTLTQAFRRFVTLARHGPELLEGIVRVTPILASVFGKTDRGRTRDHNEDTFLVADLSTGNASLLPEVREHEIGPRGSFFMVADGMGGAVAGELASEMAADLIYRHLATEWAVDPDNSPERFAFRMREAVQLANARIFDYAKEHPEVRGMGTTVTAAGVYGAELYLTQIGDSRAYLVRRGLAIQLTKDQSLMQRLVDAGELTEEEAEQSERRNIILQALGPDPQVKVDLTHQSLRRGDTLIICSDGLSGLVRREEFAEQVTAQPRSPRALRRPHRYRQRAGRSRQHHGHRGAVRGRGA